MIELTEEQRQQLRQANGTEVRLRDSQAGREYVILPAEIYDRLRALLYDDGDWTPEEQLSLLAESGKRAGWDDPEMDVYDNYDENRKKLCP
jgi:hypothetical protein